MVKDGQEFWQIVSSTRVCLLRVSVASVEIDSRRVDGVITRHRPNAHVLCDPHSLYVHGDYNDWVRISPVSQRRDICIHSEISATTRPSLPAHGLCTSNLPLPSRPSVVGPYGIYG